MTRLTKKPFNAQPPHTHLITRRFRFTRSSHAFSVCHCGMCQPFVASVACSMQPQPFSSSSHSSSSSSSRLQASSLAAAAAASPPRSRCGSRPPPVCASCQGRAVIRSECFHGRIATHCVQHSMCSTRHQKQHSALATKALVSGNDKQLLNEV